jgi:hypothetical protein
MILEGFEPPLSTSLHKDEEWFGEGCEKVIQGWNAVHQLYMNCPSWEELKRRYVTGKFVRTRRFSILE